MAQVVLGVGTSHSPMLTLPCHWWPALAALDRSRPAVVYPPDGHVLSYDDALRSVVSEDVRGKPRDADTFRQQEHRCRRALDRLAERLHEARPDIVIVVTCDQDEWFFENNMPSLAVYWGSSVPIIPQRGLRQGASELRDLIDDGYGDVFRDVPVASDLGRFIIEYLVEHDFDVSHLNYLDDTYGGRVARRYPTPTGELDLVAATPSHPQGLPHGISFVVQRLMRDVLCPILPILQNTCYPPNAVTPRRCFALGDALGDAIAAWPEHKRIAVVASGGLSHFVVDEEFDAMFLGALARKDAEALRSLPRHRMYSATSESLNWVTVAGAVHRTSLQFDLIDYVPVYRSEAGTGGGWAFATWHSTVEVDR